VHGNFIAYPRDGNKAYAKAFDLDLPRSPLLLGHDRAKMVRKSPKDAESSGRVHVENGIPLLISELLDYAVQRIACIVHNYMRAAQLLDGRLDDAIAETGFRDIAVASDCPAAQCLDEADSVRGRSGVAYALAAQHRFAVAIGCFQHAARQIRGLAADLEGLAPVGILLEIEPLSHRIEEIDNLLEGSL
jgi:hypothetical protein